MEVGVLPQEPGFEFMVDPKHIVHHQYLPVAVFPRANAYGWNSKAFRNLFGEDGWNYL